MNYYCINAELMAPLMIQDNRQSNSPRTLPYLPGSTLRGAVAAHYLRRGGTPQDQEFRQLFIKQPVIFPDLLPTGRPEIIPRCLPTTACSCKRTPGFEGEHGHGVDDILAATAVAELEKKPAIKTCRKCNQDMKTFSGFWNGNIGNPKKCEPMAVYHRHTGIDRATGTVASSIFYTTEGIADSRKDRFLIDNKQYLSAGTWMDEKQFSILNDLLDSPIFAGADRTRGMGELQISLSESEPPVFDLLRWDDQFRQKMVSITQKNLPEGIFFSIGLASHTILADRFLRPSAEITPDFPNIVELTRIIRKKEIRGWQASWGIPKNEDTAVAMGGTYLFLYTGKDHGGLDLFLNQLAKTGMGLRRPEGFGRLIVCEPLHTQQEEI
jgi:CRISPR-associated Csx10 family RAMP protein